MKKFLFLCTLSIGLCSFISPISGTKGLPVDKNFPNLLPNKPIAQAKAYRYADSIYSRIHLSTYGLEKEVFFSAFKGYEYLKSKGMLEKDNFLTIVDYTQSSTRKRLYVIDFNKGRVIFNTYVSHGARSGKEFATSFSNSDDSHKSSLGFIVTGEPYRGIAGYSLHLKGVEPGINDHIYRRSIVMHGSRYVNEQRAEENENGVGRSFGCPAVPYGQQYDIINTIKGGSCVCIFADDAHYKMSSRVLNAAFEWPDLKTKLPDLMPPSLTNQSTAENRLSISTTDKKG
ncbi:MAG: murein L,D-transpeptidase catalytic domain family protein [Arachidicoccus sp.]|nr:murein L,D-transpeptidase catalytic domain family protein [Arachidicoccus sp.]